MTRFPRLSHRSVISGAPQRHVNAQNASPVPSGARSTPLFEVTLPRTTLPRQIASIAWEEIRVEPEVHTGLKVGQGFQARALYILDGQIDIVPYEQALYWRGEAAIGGAPEEVAASQTVHLDRGDLLFFPFALDADQGSDTQLGIANPGQEPARVVGFRLSDDPAVMREDNIPGIRFYMQPFVVGHGQSKKDGDIRVTLNRLTMDAGQGVQPNKAMLASFYQIADGRVDYTWTMPDGSQSFTTSWAPNMGGWFPWADGVDVSLIAIGDDPAVVLELAVHKPGA
jgi:hypothetical protein